MHLRLPFLCGVIPCSRLGCGYGGGDGRTDVCGCGVPCHDGGDGSSSRRTESEYVRAFHPGQPIRRSHRLFWICDVVALAYALYHRRPQMHFGIGDGGVGGVDGGIANVI